MMAICSVVLFYSKVDYHQETEAGITTRKIQGYRVSSKIRFSEGIHGSKMYRRKQYFIKTQSAYLQDGCKP